MRPDADQSFWAPVGVRHAVNRVTAWTQSPQRTLCGQVATGWHIFPGLALTGEHGADCHRCLQLIGDTGAIKAPIEVPPFADEPEA